MKCKWAGDVNDEYCKSCNGVTMVVDNTELSCTECAGYEAGEESAVEDEPIMTPPENEIPINNMEKNEQKSNKVEDTNNNTKKTEKLKNEPKNKITNNDSEIKKVSEENDSVEKTDGIKVISLRYTSGATIKKGDNYFKFVAEEEWDVSQVDSIDDARDMLWAKLNAEVDKQVEEVLQNM